MPVSECRSETYPPSLSPPPARWLDRRPPAPPKSALDGFLRLRSPARAHVTRAELARSGPRVRSCEKEPWRNICRVGRLLAGARRGIGAALFVTFRGHTFSVAWRARGDDVGRRRRTHRRAPDGISRGELGRRVARGGVARWGPGGAPRVLVPRRRPRHCASTSPAPPAVPRRAAGDRHRRATGRRLWRDVLAASARRVTRRGVRGVAAATDPPKATRGRAARALGRIARYSRRAISSARAARGSSA